MHVSSAKLSDTNLLGSAQSTVVLKLPLSQYSVCDSFAVFKPGARGRRPRSLGFLKSFHPRTLVYVCVCVCVCPPPSPLITSHVKGMRNKRVRQPYGPSVSCTTLAVSKLNGRGPSNTAHRERLLK